MKDKTWVKRALLATLAGLCLIPATTFAFPDCDEWDIECGGDIHCCQLEEHGMYTTSFYNTPGGGCCFRGEWYQTCRWICVGSLECAQPIMINEVQMGPSMACCQGASTTEYACRYLEDCYGG